MRVKNIIKKCVPKKTWEIVSALRSELISGVIVLRCLFAYVFSPYKTILVCNMIQQTKKGEVLPNNWGDDLNVNFFREATGLKVLYYPNSKIARFLGLKNFVLIGSGLIARPQKKTVIWGTGVSGHFQTVFFKAEKEINRPLKIATSPKKILAVRGPLTREWLINQGIKCPEIFGDPALLLPRFYEPKKLKRHFRIGVIPHFLTLNNFNDRIESFISKMTNAKLILVQGYKNWRDFIDEICSCDFVVSESLHGLIVAAAYGVPATWIEFCEHVNGWDFKFRDFYASLENGTSLPPPLFNYDFRKYNI